MVEKLEKLLEYQKVDIELRRALDEIEKHEFTGKMEKAKQEFALAKNNVLEAEKAAESIVTFYENSRKYYEENFGKFEDLEDRLNKLADDDDAARRDILAQMETLRDKMAELEKKLSDRKAKSDNVIHGYLEAQERGKKMRAVFNSVKEKLEEFKAQKAPHINELTARLKSMESDIDKTVFASYKELTAERKYPAVVPARTPDNGKSFSCTGCGLAISQKVKDELVEKGVCRCDNCRRIIYYGK